MDVTLTAFGYTLNQVDLFASVYEVEGFPIQIIKTHRGGWQARPRPRGRERTRILTSPTETPLDVVLLLIYHAHLPAPPGLPLTYRQLKKQRQRFERRPEERELTATTPDSPKPGRWR
ncbi:hypothetical protein [Janibacter melonis]|uniref:hypothetical protein n=1 Tax=Janibacter melonis TaxID=262209 RepID=UPI00191B2F2C|nr:hypothetical protein [Janibacter melonis]